jgi:hypothetical protein
MGISKISANATTFAAATTINSDVAQAGANVDPNILGFSVYDDGIFEASNGFISINYANLSGQLPVNPAISLSKEAAGNGASLTLSQLGVSLYDSKYFNVIDGFVSANADSFVTTVSGQTASINVGPPTSANSAVRLADLVKLPADLIITAIGSLDIQMTASNAYDGSVDQSGTPSYMSGASNITLIGNASSLGVNYTVAESTYNESSAGSGVQAVVSLIIDVANACNLSSSMYLTDGVSINPSWKGNFQFNAFSALFKLHEANFWDYPFNNSTYNHETFAYQCDMIPVTTDYTSANYGQYTVHVNVAAAQPYHNANLGARWMGTATKVRNLLASIQTGQ